MNVLEIKGLSKSFGEKKVLCGLDLSVPEHSIFGFVGKNGAGKTTTMKSVLGLIKPNEGEIWVSGEKVEFGQTKTNSHIGYLPDVPKFYSFMNAREYLALCGECLNMDKKDIANRSEELLTLVGLSQEKKRIKGFSRGMKQRLGIAQALMTSPKLLICDEPTSALDPIGRKEILDLLLSVKDRTTVLFSTHILSDVERICTDVALLHDGRIAVQGSADHIKRSYGKEEFVLEVADDKGRDLIVSAFESARRIDKDTFAFDGGDAEMFAMIDFIREKGISFRRIERAESSLEALFLEVVKK